MEESTNILNILKALRNSAWLNKYAAANHVDIKSMHGHEGYITLNTFYELDAENYIQLSHFIWPDNSIHALSEAGKEFVQNGLNQPKIPKNV